MQPIHSCQFEISANMVDCFHRARPSTLLYLAQEAAGAHCKLLGAESYLAEKGLFWAVLRYRFQITRLPKKGETVTVKTWPMPTTRTAFPRSTAAYDADGNELFRAIGLWVLMDPQSRSMVLPGKSGLMIPGTDCEGQLLPPSSLTPVTGENSLCRTVGFSELDQNGHMNNTRYMNWIDDLLPAAFHKEHPVREFTLCYLNEAREGDVLQLNWQLSDGPVLVADAHRMRTDIPETSSRVFSAKVVY